MCLPIFAAIGSALAGTGAAAGAAGATTAALSTAQALSLTASIAGTAFSAMGAYQQASGQKAMMQYQAQVAEVNKKNANLQALDAEKRGDLAQQTVGARVADLRGRQRAALAANGMDLNEGSPADVLASTDYYGMQDQLTQRDNTNKEAWAIRSRGAGFGNDAAMYRAGADATSPLLAASGSLLTGVGQVSDRWYSYTK